MKPVNATTETFKAEVLDEQLPVIVDFWAEWCGPCRMVAPVLDEISSEYQGKLKIVKVNVDEEPQLAMDYQVTGIPLLGVFQGGKIVKHLVGARPKAAIISEISEFIS
ncbi:MAG: thioredoxin [Actinobacteria bacterium]|nr:thioredoxin [Actinomycetota bacterium]